MATLRYQTLILDGSNLILPWYTAGNAYDHYMDTLWTFLPTVQTVGGYKVYYFDCGFVPEDGPTSRDTWINDWGERVPNFVEFARLYYGYGGGTGPMTIAKALMDYAIANARTASNANWPNVFYGTGAGGSSTINGTSPAPWAAGSILTDLAGDMAASAYKLYLYDGTASYRTAALACADTLAAKIVAGNASNSPWPYVVNSSTGASVSPFVSNFDGILTMWDMAIAEGEPNASAYTSARTTLTTWLQTYPLANQSNANWVSGHSDTYVNGNSNWCCTTCSDMALYMLDNPTWDPNHTTHIPELLTWLEAKVTAGGYVRYGAHVPPEQAAYVQPMGYQAARLAAVYARWYLTSGNATHKDLAYRGLNYATYMMQSNGVAADGEDDLVGAWWSDCYGESPRMFFHGMAGMPEYAPSGESHLLYTKYPVKDVSYATGTIQYTATGLGTDYLRCAFNPASISVAGSALSEGIGYTKTSVGGTDYSVTIPRTATGVVVVSEVGNAPAGIIAARIR